MTTIDLQHVEELVDQLPPNQQLELIRHITLRIAAGAPRAPSPSLEGSWKGFPEDFDLDAALKEIRSEWKAELDEMAE